MGAKGGDNNSCKVVQNVIFKMRENDDNEKKRECVIVEENEAQTSGRARGNREDMGVKRGGDYGYNIVKNGILKMWENDDNDEKGERSSFRL